jgi:hypothetical protein
VKLVLIYLNLYKKISNPQVETETSAAAQKD